MQKMHYTGNEVNGGITLASALAGTAFGPVIAFMVAPENIWAVQLVATLTTTVVLFAVGKGIDIYFRLRDKNRKD